MTSSDPFDARKGEDRRGASYARFIPREELGGVKAWNPGDLSGGPARQTHVHRASDEPAVADVASQIAAQMRAMRQAGYQDGYRDGLVALEAFKQSFASQTTAQIGTLMQSLDAELNGLQQDMARSLAVAATHLARQIVRSELGARPELVTQVAQEAVDTLLLSARHITLRVHPDDQGHVARGADEVIKARGARLLADATISRGGCIVESDIGVIDAAIETRWRRAAASLGHEEDWNADLGAPEVQAWATDSDAPEDEA
ncbi:MAG TPA: flagellar assembly protein FliH [Burkholderiaceae bacterium]|jgi:flagellar assembly protein FliH